MKEQTLLEMKKKVEATTRILQQIINEITHLRELGIGSLETLKLMPGYPEAIDQLKKNMEEEYKKKKEKESNGVSE